MLRKRTRKPAGRSPHKIQYKRKTGVTDRMNHSQSAKINTVLEKLFSNIHVGIAYLDHHFDILQINRAFAQTAGRDPSFFKGKNFFDVFPNPEHQAIFQHVLDTGQPHRAYGQFFEPIDARRPGTGAGTGPSYWDWSLQAVSEQGENSPRHLLLEVSNVTAREQAQLAMQQIQVIFERLFEASSDANILIDHQGLMISINSRVEQLFGYTRDELLGQPVEILVPEDVQQEHAEQRSRYIHEPAAWTQAHSQVLPQELHVRRKDGSLFPAEISLSPILTNEGLLVLSIIRDITQRKAKEEQLQRQTSLVRLLQEVALAANEADTIESAFKFALDRICKHLNWPLGHAIVVNPDISIRPGGIWYSDKPDKFSEFRLTSEKMSTESMPGLPGRVIETGQPVWFGKLHENRQFTRMEAASKAGLKSALGIPVLANREVVGVLEFYHVEETPPNPQLMAVLPHIGVQLGRVVERKRAEDALRKTAAQLRTILTNLPLVLWVTDRKGKIILIEGRNVRSMGIDSARYLNQSIYDLWADNPHFLSYLDPVLEGNDMHFELPAPTGQTYEVFITPYYGVEDSLDGMIGLAFDVSERKRMESELEEMRRKLLDSVENERIRLAHEIHDGPLQDLYGAFYQVQEVKYNLDAQGQELAGRAMETIRSVNTTLRMICGELHPTTLAHLGLRNAIRSHTEMLQERKPGLIIYLDLEDDSGLGPDGQAQMLPINMRLAVFRVYQQLISNIIRHSEARHAWVRLQLLENEVILNVDDDGKGFHLPERWIELVREGKLGLVTIQERVQGMGGSIKIKSIPNHGTRIEVRFPRKERGLPYINF